MPPRKLQLPEWHRFILEFLQLFSDLTRRQLHNDDFFFLHHGGRTLI